MKMSRYLLLLPDEILERVKKKSDKRGWSIAYFIRKAIEELLRKTK